MTLTTLQDLKAHLAITSTTHDAFLTSLIARCSEAIEKWCSREFALAERTEYHDGRGVGRLVLRQRPVAPSPAPVVHDDIRHVFDAKSLVPAAELVVREQDGIIEHANGDVFADARQNVKVTYTAGYATPPGSLAQACILLCAALFNRARQGADGLASENHGAYSVTYATTFITPEIREMLMPYKEVRV